MWKLVETAGANQWSRVPAGVSPRRKAVTNQQLQFQQTKLWNLLSESFLSLVVVMNVVELWKAPQPPDTRRFMLRLQCGIFVMDVERSRAILPRSKKQGDFSSSFNTISPTCPRIFHSGVRREFER
jgi:hypothetical protein